MWMDLHCSTVLLNTVGMSGVVAHTLTASTQEAEEEAVLAYIVGGQPGLHNETLV